MIPVHVRSAEGEEERGGRMGEASEFTYDIFKCTYTHTHTHTHTHNNTCTHTKYKHAHIHTRTHTYIFNSILFLHMYIHTTNTLHNVISTTHLQSIL